jgi:hypothetical protein
MVYLAKTTRSQGRRRAICSARSSCVVRDADRMAEGENPLSRAAPTLLRALCQYGIRKKEECGKEPPKGIPQGLKPELILRYLRHD